MNISVNLGLETVPNDKLKEMLNEIQDELSNRPSDDAHILEDQPQVTPEPIQDPIQDPINESTLSVSEVSA